jgi:hypothetical protein
MGARANYVLVEDGRYRIGHDKWGANRLLHDLCEGPLATRHRLGQRVTADAGSESSWYDVDWCEGAILMDADARVLLFFGGYELTCEIAFRRAFVAWLVDKWAGWTVRWAEDGIAEIVRYLGLPESVVAGTYERERVAPSFVQVYPNERESPAVVVASARWEGGRLGLYALSPMLEDLFAVGAEGLVGRLRAFDTENEDRQARVLEVEARKDAQGPPRARFDSVSRTLTMTSGGTIWSGIHLDVEPRRVSLWSHRVHRHREMRAKAPQWWPDWGLESLGDRFEAHAEKTDGRIVFRIDEPGERLLAEWLESRVAAGR